MCVVDLCEQLLGAPAALDVHQTVVRVLDQPLAERADTELHHRTVVEDLQHRERRTMVQCSSVRFSAVQCNSVQFSAVRFSAVQCSAVQFSTVRFSAVQYSAQATVTTGIILTNHRHQKNVFER